MSSGTNVPQPVDLAIIIPAYNEADGIVRTIERVRDALHGIDVSSEIVVVDDGSSDDTGARAAVTGVRLLTHVENLGYGAALKTGILQARAPVVAIMDGDCSYDPGAIPELYAKIEHADMVVGARRLSSGGNSLARGAGKWVLGRFAGFLAGRRIPDVNSGQRVMRRDVVHRYLHLLPSGFSFTTTLTLAMVSNGHRVVHVPVAYTKRVGRSKLRPAAFGSFMLLVVRAIVLFNPLKVFVPLGGVPFFIGVILLVDDLRSWSISEAAVIAFLAAIVVWSVGLLADMISRIQMQPPPPS
jgi:glycosyltransferase involved in cell wall biosynthesis